MNETPSDETIVLFEKAWGSRPGKLTAALTEFGLTETAYFARLAQAIRNPACEQMEPGLVHRLQTIVDRRARRRSAARSTTA